MRISVRRPTRPAAGRCKVWRCKAILPPRSRRPATRLTGLRIGCCKTRVSWFPTNDLARFEKSQTFNGLQWGGVPYVWPFLRSITVSNQDFVFGGGIPDAGADPALLSSPPEVLSRTNLLYRNWEITGQRIEQWLYLGQFARFVSHKAQLMSGSPGVLWLKAVAPKLGASKTDITQTGPNQLSFNRKSTIGFTGLELNLLADWLESPQFPIGLYTFLAPPPQM